MLLIRAGNASVLVLAIFFSSACASLSKSECRNSDWSLIGYNDGAQGRATGRLEDHRRACAKHNVSPDMDRYLEGHARGVTQFCTLRNGLSYGEKGVRYEGVCPAALEPAFLRGFAHGKQVHDTNAELGRIRSQRSAAIKRIEENQAAAAQLEKLLAAGGGSEESRRGWIRELKDLNAEKVALEDDIQRLDYDAAQLNGQLRALRAQAQQLR